MKTLRLLLLPFGLIYWCIVSIRNLLYDKGIFKSYIFPVPIIAIGNLSTGGTGKSPQTEYLIRLLQDTYSLATLSRGYKRKSKGFILANNESNATILGDEPYQFHKKFPEITVAVDADRKNGIEKLLALPVTPQVILLDDAYQHRRVKADFYILLTAYNDLYADDYILPAGNLREGREGAKRAKAIIVTKCPVDISESERTAIVKKLQPLKEQKVYFTYIAYDDYMYNKDTKLAVSSITNTSKVLVAGIAKPKPFFNYIKSGNDICMAYPDHHNFTDSEIAQLKKLSENNIVITTEKDYMRLEGKLPNDRLFYLPIKTAFIENETDFNTSILEYIKKHSSTIKE